MKKLLVVVMTLLFVLSLSACGNGGKDEDTPIYSSYDNIDAYTKYLKKVEATDDDLSYTYYDYEDGDYGLYLDNNNENLFYRAVLYVYDTEDAKDAIFDSDGYYYLIRPLDYIDFYPSLDKVPDFYELDGVEAYKLNYEENLNYDFIYDYNIENKAYFLDLIYDGTLTDELVERIAKKEYVIAVLTDLLDEEHYFYEASSVEYDGDYYPVVSTSLYKAITSYDDKTIEIYKGEELIKTITMD